MKKTYELGRLAMAGLMLAAAPAQAADKIKAVIVDGRNSHDWKRTSPAMQQILENSGLFTVDFATAGEDLSHFRPGFSDYDVVVLNYTGPLWPEETRNDFVNYVKNGGGLVVVHNTSTTFIQWEEYNRITGLGGWEGRNEKHGPYVYYTDDGQLVRDESPGHGGSHGRIHEFVVETRQPDHPIMKGLPPRWRHTPDELYDRLRGPAENLTVLATAHATRETGGSGRHEPQLMTIKYGKGRVFHTTMGHDIRAYHGLGFQVTFLRGAQWAATGEVTVPAPDGSELPAEGPAAQRDPSDVKPVMAERSGR